MAGLLAAEDIAVCAHIFCNVFIADGRFFIAYSQCVKSLIQAHVAHDRCDDLLFAEYAAVAHIFAADVENMIAGYDIALFVDSQAAIGIAVKGKADIELIFQNELLHLLDMGRAAVYVYVNTVGIIGDNICVGAQGIEHAFGHHPRGAVCAVEADLLALV